MTTPLAYAPATQFLGLAFETTPGTPAAAPLYYIPFKPGSLKWSPLQKMLNDDAIRTSMVDVYDQVQGTRYDTIDFTMYAFLDSLPLIMRGLVGSSDTKTGSADPVTHKLSLLNNSVATGNQPPSMTAWFFDGGICHQVTWAMVDEVSVKITADGLCEIAVKLAGFPATTVTAPSFASTTAVAPPGWSTALTAFGGTALNIISLDLMYKRGVKPVPAMTGTTSPLQMWAGPLSSQGGKLTATYQGSTAFAYGLANTKGPLTAVLSPAGDVTHSHTWQHTLCSFKNPLLDSGKDWVEFSVDIMPLPDTTDETGASGGGVSPLLYTAINAVTTTY